ncbi:MAG: YfhO family protein [bacterium]
MKKNQKALFLISLFILLIFIRNIAFWSKEQTFIFGDTAVYALYLTALSKNIFTIFSPAQNFFFWNQNYLSVGMPTLSIVDLGYLYPPNIIIAFIAKILGDSLLVFPLLTLLAFLHLGFGGYFIYKILKNHWKLDAFSSLIGGLLWVFIGFNVEYTTATSVLFSGSYLPICFYLNLKYKESRCLKYFFLFFLFLAFSFLVGYPMPAIIIFILCFAYNLINDERLDIKKRFLTVTLEQLKGFFLITLPIISPLYFTSMQNFFHSVRGTVLTLEGFMSHTTIISNLTESIIPLNTPFNNASATNIVHIYFSVVAIVIFLQAKDKAVTLKDKRNFTVLIFGIVGIVLSLGNLTYIPTLIYLTTPIISFFRRLNVFSLVPGFALCILIPQFVKNSFRQKKISSSLAFFIKILVVLLLITQTMRVLYNNGEAPLDYNALLQSISITAIVGIIAILAIISFRYYPKISKTLLVLALLVEAGTIISSRVYLNSKIAPTKLFAPNELTKYIQEITKPGERVDMLETQHNYSADYLGIEQTAGYVALASEYGVRINEAFTYEGEDYNAQNLRDIVGVKYIVRKKEDADPNLKKVAEIKQNAKTPNFYIFNYHTLSWGAEATDTSYFVYENTTYLPRLYLASSIIPTPEQSKYLLGYIGNLKDHKTVFMDQRDVKRNEISSEGDVEMLEYKRNYIKASVKSEGPTFLANSTGYYPGWSVKINGEKAKIIQTNWFMIGVYVPKGDNIVEFTYTPYGINWGLLYIFFVSIYWLIVRKHSIEKTKMV